MKVASLTIKNFEDFFYELTKGYAITSKRLSNIKSMLNGIMKRCVSREIIAHNILSDVGMQIFHKRCKPSTSAKDNYTEAERQQILDYLSDKTDLKKQVFQVDAVLVKFACKHAIFLVTRAKKREMLNFQHFSFIHLMPATGIELFVGLKN